MRASRYGKEAIAHIRAEEAKEDIRETLNGPWKPRRAYNWWVPIPLGIRPRYWGPFHDKTARKAAKQLRMSRSDAGRVLAAFFANSPDWVDGDPVMRTDEPRHYGPSIFEVLQAARRAGIQRFLEALPTIARSFSGRRYGRSYYYWWDMSRRQWYYWKTVAHLQRWGVTVRFVPWTVLRAVSRMKGTDFLFARAILRWSANHPEMQRIDVADFFSHLAACRRGDEVMRLGVAYSMPPGDVWRVWHNYVPKVEAVKKLDRTLVILLAERKYTKYFLRLVRQLPQNDELEHAVHATALLALWFGERAAAFVKRTGLSVHDAGINLPAPYELQRDAENYDMIVGISNTATEKVTFLWRHAHRVNDAVKVVANWSIVLAEMSELPGAPTPLSKGGIDAALEILKGFNYDGVKSKEFARVAAECGASQADFEFWQDRWLEGLEGLVAQTVPSPGTFELGELRLTQLSKSDPRALFAGDYTGCCQHPSGLGADCAWHAHESSDGAIWAVERHGRIIAQAWVWRGGSDFCTLIIDSVEASASIGSETRAQIKSLFQQAAEVVLGRLCVKRVFVGTSYGGVHWRELPSQPRPARAPVSYTDSQSVWLIAEEKG